MTLTRMSDNSNGYHMRRYNQPHERNKLAAFDLHSHLLVTNDGRLQNALKMTRAPTTLRYSAQHAHNMSPLFPVLGHSTS